ncbi:hypothetical protein ABZ716_03845 [Streptomyces sp. NPDC006687]
MRTVPRVRPDGRPFGTTGATGTPRPRHGRAATAHAQEPQPGHHTEGEQQ